MTRIPVGWVQLASVDPPIALLVRLSEERPNVDSGYGGWNVVSRPHRRPLTTWQGSPPLHMTIGLLFDAWVEGRSVEPQISRLERMATPTAEDGAPPRVQISATGNAVPHQGRTWVIDSLTWGDALMGPRGNRRRQQVTVGLTEYVADVYVTQKSASNRQRSRVATAKTRAGAGSKRVIAASRQTTATATQLQAVGGGDFGQGEDLLTIAARELGDADRWPEIAALNGLRDPRAIRPGQVIRLP